MGGLALGSALTAGIAALFSISLPDDHVVIARSAILSIVAVRSVGETDINRLRMGKYTAGLWRSRARPNEHESHGSGNHRAARARPAI